MKQMTLIEMDGFLKGKCIPRDLKVNETNAEYLVRKFGELESKLETALRECRSAGITIDNLEAKCSALAAKINVINELMEVAEQVNKLAQEETEKLAHERNTLAAENAGLKAVESNLVRNIINDLGDTEYQYEKVQTPATDAFLAEVRAEARNEGINYTASRLAAAFNHGFINKSLREVFDVTRMILSAKEELANEAHPIDGLSGEYAEKSLEEWAEQIRKGGNQ
ncbi:hypothetical protein A193_01373 [Escherichia coli KTE234]|nr:hypothetical protein A193_01373 [Escherichia coli KTE234]HBA4372193.1 DUF4752 domain-containing protein [Escherichia coli]